MTFSASNIDQIETHLASHPYLSEGGLPGAEDAQVFFDLGKLPEVGKYPNTHFWYLFINSFSNDLMKKWIEKTGKAVKQQAKKEQPKKQAVEEEDDLFGESSAPTEPVKPKPKPQPKKEKAKPIAKSIIVFEVKVEDTETDLDALAKKILERQIDGLVWSTDIKKLDVAYGIQKLQLGCVIEDAKVLTDDIFEPIEAWEEVQSVDMISMQKL